MLTGCSLVSLQFSNSQLISSSLSARIEGSVRTNDQRTGGGGIESSALLALMTSTSSPRVPMLQNNQDNDDNDLDETLQKLFDSSSSDEAGNEDEHCLQKGMHSSNGERQATHNNGLVEARAQIAPCDRPTNMDDKPLTLSKMFRGTNSAAQHATPVCSGSPNSRVRVERLISKKRKAPSGPTEKARNSFHVVGNITQKQTSTGYAITDKNVSNMVLRGSKMNAERLSALFELSERVDISQISTRFDDIRAGRVGGWVVFGCLVKKHAKRETKTGAKFAIWSLYNMPRWSIDKSQNPPEATIITVLVFDEAFSHLHNLVEGTALAMRHATLLPPRESETGARTERGGTEWCGYCIKVTKADQVVNLGMCQDYRLCGEPNGDLGECGVWFDANRLKMCTKHTQQKRMRMLRGTRMDINNAERPIGQAECSSRAPEQVKDVSRSSFNAPPPRFQNVVADGQKSRHVADRKKAVALVRRQGFVRGAEGGVRASSLSGALRQRAYQQDGIPPARRMDERMVTAATRGKAIVEKSRLQPRKTVEKDTRQLKYDSAVEVLIQLGFRVNRRGDLIAPSVVSGVTLQKGSLPAGSTRKPEGSTSAFPMAAGSDTAAASQTNAICAREDVYLSDESA